MSFTFGTGSASSFGSSPAKPAGFGTPLAFGTPSTTTTTTATSTTASTGFGGFGASTFGATPQHSFGSTFGTQQQASTSGPIFGSGGGGGGGTFGQPTAAVAPTFGSSFGVTTTASTPAFGTITTASTPAFGNANLFGSTTAKPNLFGGTAATTPSLFSQPGGTTTATASNLFGAPTTSALFGTATTATTAMTAPLFSSAFGTATTSAPSLFGGMGTSTTPSLAMGTGLFGTGTPGTTQSSLFGGFGTSSAAAPTSTMTTTGGFGGFGGFGTAATSTASLFGGGFGAKPVQPPVVPSLETLSQQVLASCYSINIFSDERDEVLKKWNMLQACWGIGKGYYSPNQPPIEYNHKNPFYRFKAMSYRLIPTRDNSEGMVMLMFNKKASELLNQKEVLISGIGGMLGNRSSLVVTVDNVKALTDSTCEVTISVAEKGATGTARKIAASELASFLNQPMQKQQLTNAGVFLISPFATLTPQQLEDYLNNPPSEFDPQLWKVAVEDSPDQKRYIPCQVNGFTDLKKRMICQENQTALLRSFIDATIQQLQEQKKKHAASAAQIAELKQRFLLLQHRLLRVLVKQESTRKIGMTLQPEEENLRERFEAMRSIVESPNQFRGQIRDLLSNVRVIHVVNRPPHEIYKMDPKAQEDIKQFLMMQQQGISELVKIINEDLKDLKVIHDGLNEVIHMNQLKR